jgi:hypothetical protein
MLYRKMPLKAISRLWGKFNNLNLPTWLRTPAYSLYIWMFNCKLEEAAIEDLHHYRNLGEFFRRQLKPYVRTVDPEYSIVSVYCVKYDVPHQLCWLQHLCPGYKGWALNKHKYQFTVSLCFYLGVSCFEFIFFIAQLPKKFQSCCTFIFSWYQLHF